MYEVVEKQQLNPQIALLKIKAPQIAEKRKPGQFIMFRVDEKGERVPLTIADSDPVEGTVTVICQAIGGTTTKFNSLKKGDFIADFVGPLGKPTHIENFGTSVCIGGGVGVAEAYPLAKALKDAGNKTITIMGFRNKDLIFMEDELKAASDEFYVTTDDGSYGEKGLVTDVLKKIVDSGRKIDFVLAIGPIPMMKAVCDVTRPHNIKTMVSLNPIMVDGTGMCGACRVTVGGQRKFACVDGPEFDGFDVDFDELIQRQRMYREQEQVLMEKHKCMCK